MKSWVKVVLALVVLLAVCTAAFAAAPTIKKTKYDGNGKVEIDFRTKVRYDQLSIEVRDLQGNLYSARVRDRDNDELEFVVAGYKAGETYTYTLSGVYRRGTQNTGETVSGSFTIPLPNTVSIESVEYDREDREVSVDIETGNGRGLRWKRGATVKITDSNGKRVSTRLIEREDDGCEIRARLTLGKTYTVYVSGVKAAGASSYSTIKKTFVAWDD